MARFEDLFDEEPSQKLANTNDQFDAKPSHDLFNIGKCLALARQPQQHGECGRLFCMSCIFNTQSNKCPNCGLQPAIFCDEKSQQEVLTLQVKCSYLDNGCQWTGELRSLYTHTEECPYRAVACPNNCNPQTPLLHKNLEQHSQVCPRRPSLGKEEPMNKETVPSTLKNTIIAQDSKKEDGKTRTYSVHEIAHPLQMSATNTELFPCKFAMFGCTIQLTAKELKEHQTDDQLHLQITKEKVLEITELLEARERRFREHTEQIDREIVTLQRDIEMLAIRVTPVVFAVSNFSEKKREDQIIFSPSFYLGPTSYNIYIKIYTNGHENAQNSYVSLFVCLDQGVNDEFLDCPFQGTVAVELLNQLKDNNHYKKVFTFPDDDVSARPEGSTQRKGIGYNHFIAYGNLNLNFSKTCQYLKDDKLYFRVSDT